MVDPELSDGLKPVQVDLIVEIIKVLQTPRFEKIEPYEVAEAFGTAMAVVLKNRIERA